MEDTALDIKLPRTAPRMMCQLSNHPAAGNARSVLRFAFGTRRPGVPEPERRVQGVLQDAHGAKAVAVPYSQVGS